MTRITTCLGLVSAISVGVGLASYQLTDLVYNDEQHYQVQENIRDINYLIQKAIIAENSYLTTRQVSYLENYDNITKEIKLKIAVLKQETINNPAQQRRIATLEPLIERKLPPPQTTKSKNNSIQMQVLPEQKAKLTNQISVTLREMEKTEDVVGRSQANITNHQSILTFSALICLNLLILGGVYYFGGRSCDRKHKKTALEQLDLTDAILDRVGALVVVLDRQGRIFRFNRAAEQITGYSLATMKGKYFWELFSTSSEAQTAKNNWSKLLENQDSNQYENYLLSFDGSSRRIAWSNTTLRSRTGEIEYAIASGIDITEHSSAQSALRSSEQHLQNVLNSLFTFVAVLTPDGTLIEANSALLSAAGLQAEDVLGLPLTQTYWWSYSTAVQTQMQSAIECVSQGKSVRYEVEGRIGENQFMMIDFALTPMYDSAGKISYLIASGIDLTERKQAEAEREQANEQLSGWVNELKQRNREITLLGEMSDFLQACLTVEEACITLAQLVQPLFPGASGGIFLKNSSKNLVEPVASWGLPTLCDLKSFTPTDCWGLRRGKPHWVDDTDNGLLCKHLHHVLPAESLCVPMMAQGEALGVLYLSSLETGSLTAAKQQLATTVAEHIALALANLKLRETLQNQSVRDVLSGLYNRRYMEEALTQEMEKCDRKQQPLSLIMLDVDNFKSINDTFGHNAGDVVLRELGKLLQSYVRAGDIACRYGGEEFTLILPEACLNVTQQRAEQILAAVKQLNVECSGHSLSKITVSIGVACFPDHGHSGEALLKAADTALYQAQQGRDQAIVAQIRDEGLEARD